MSYYFSKTVKGKSFDEATERVKEELKKEGFGVLSEINVSETLKNRIDVDFKKYKILGACSPRHAYQALKAEDKIGVFLPCNVVVEEHENGEVEVSAVDPIASMISVGNNSLGDIAIEIQQKLKKVIESLS
jgi:uncharacterized protein (DUF302 family)